MLQCRRIQKKRGTLFGPLRMAPSNTIDEFDNKIECARLVGGCDHEQDITSCTTLEQVKLMVLFKTRCHTPINVV